MYTKGGYEAAAKLAMKSAQLGMIPHNSINAYNFGTKLELMYVYPWTSINHIFHCSINETISNIHVTHDKSHAISKNWNIDEIKLIMS